MIAIERRGQVLRSFERPVGRIETQRSGWALVAAFQVLIWWPMLWARSGDGWAEGIGWMAALGAGVWGWWRAKSWAPVTLALPALIGLGQWCTKATVVPEETARQAIQWLAVAGVGAAVLAAFRDSAARRQFRAGLLVAGWLVVGWGLVESALLGGGFGPIRSPNHYAVLCEMVLPLAWLKSRENGNWWIAALPAVAGIAAGSRAGTAIVAAECLALWWLTDSRWRSSKSVVAAGLAALGSGIGCWWMMRSSELLLYRDSIWVSAIELWKENPLWGHGLGTFLWTYPAKARFDTGEIVDHAHNDWLEWGAEGGIAMVAVMALSGVMAGRRVGVAPWALGPVAALAHAMVDYPLQKYAFLMLWGVLVALAAEERWVKARVGSPAKEPAVSPA